MEETHKTLVDTLSLAVVGATLIKWLPAIAALFSIMWTIIRIVETDTFQRLKGYLCNLWRKL